MLKRKTCQDIILHDFCPENHCWTFISKGSCVSTKNGNLIDNYVENENQPIYIKKSIESTKSENDDYPKGSNDLYFIPNDLLIDIIGIFDFCIRARNVLKLAPFRFEDLCVCLSCPGQSSLLADIFMCFLKVILADDELQGISYFTSNERDFAFLFYHAIDKFTWIEVIKLYFLSNCELLNEYKSIINKPWFPIGTLIHDKVKLLNILMKKLLNTSILLESYISGTIITPYETNCTICGKNGNIIKCSICPKVYHKTCLKIQINENQLFICKLCCDNTIVGLSEDILTVYTNAIGALKPIGIDNKGKLYWFTVRRLFVQDKNGKVLYYSSSIALKNLLIYLEKNLQNKQLVKNISQSQVIWNQINKNISILRSECPLNYKSIYEIDSIENEYKLSEYYYIGMNGNYQRYYNYYSTEECSFWNYSQNKKSFSSSKINYYDLNWRGNFFNLIKDVQNLEKVKGAPTRVIHEFAFLKLIQNTLIHFESCLPSPYLHPVWYHQLPAWVKAVRLATSPAKLASLILLFCRMIKPFAFQNCWYESTGHCLPCKIITPDLKNVKKFKINSVLVRNYQISKIIKEYNDDGQLVKVDIDVKDKNQTLMKLIDKNITSNIKQKLNNNRANMINFVKNKNTPKHKIWEQKGEEYRITGEDGWCLINNTKNNFINLKKIKLDDIVENLKKGNRNYKLFYEKVSKNNERINDNLPKLTLLTQIKHENQNNNVNKDINENQNINIERNKIADYIPGESIQQFFKRKGSKLLSKIESSIYSNENVLINNPEVLLNRESTEFACRRQDTLNSSPILSVYRISKEERKRLARKGGVYELKGFNYNFITNRSLNWPNCFSRPSISRIWENKMLNVNSLFDIAFLLKILFSSLNIGQMNNNNKRDTNEIALNISGDLIYPIYCYQTEEGIIMEEIIDAIPILSNGLVYKYHVKKSVQKFSKSLYGLSSSSLSLGNYFYLNKNGNLEIITKNINQNDQNDGRYVSSYRKSHIPLNDLRNEHVLRSRSLDKHKLPEKIITSLWLGENDVNILLVKRFWARIEQERTFLQTEFTQQYKKWLKSSSKLCITYNSTFKNVFQNLFSTNNTKLLENNTMNSVNYNCNYNYNYNKFDSLNNKSKNEMNKDTNLIVSSYKSQIKVQDLNYEDMLIYNNIREEKSQIEDKMKLLLQFKIENLLNAHAEYLKMNIRRNKNLTDKQINEPYYSFYDTYEKLTQQYLHEGFILSKLLRDKDVEKNLNDINLKIRRSKRPHKPNTFSNDYINNSDNFLHKSNDVSNSTIICCCSVENKHINYNKDFVVCNGCQNIFHCVCYGFSKLKSLVLPQFYCPTCEFYRIDDQNNLEKLNYQSLNCVCKNNSIDDLDIIKCCLCYQMSHYKCLNLPFNDFKCEEYFVCNECQNDCIINVQKLYDSYLSYTGISAIKNILKYLNSLKFATPFLFPVDTTIVKDYTNVIKTPMDLQTLLTNFENNLYIKLENFIHDILLIFKNCRLYNAKDTFYVKYANLLECAFFLKLNYLCKRVDIIVR